MAIVVSYKQLLRYRSYTYNDIMHASRKEAAVAVFTTGLRCETITVTLVVGYTAISIHCSN